MNIGIVGLGLIGASFGKSLIKKGEHKVFGYDINEEVILKAELVDAINAPLTEDNVNDMDIVIISVYPRSFLEVAEKYLPKMKAGSLLMDFCGIKPITF